MGGLDKKHLSWSTRSTFPAGARYIWCVRFTNRCTFFAVLAFDRIVLVSAGGRLDGGNGDSRGIDTMGFPDLRASACGKSNGYLTPVCVHYLTRRSSLRRDDADIHVESPFWKGRHVERTDVQAKIMEAGLIPK